MVLANIESLMVGLIPMPSMITLRQAGENEGVDPSLVLPIVIGTSEAGSIVAALEEETSPRPLTHKLAVDLLAASGSSVSRVVIDRVEEQTFYCTVYLRLQNGMFTHVDARPSDGIALAVRANAPLFIEEEVLRRAGTPRALTGRGDKRLEMEEFDKFIEQVEPEDFVTHGGPTVH